MKTFKQVTAMAIVILWIMLIITTLVTAIINTETSNTLFKGLIVIDIILPVVAYAIKLMSKLLNKRK